MAATAESVIASLARDINCLADADRSTRRGGLDRIAARLSPAPPPPDAPLDGATLQAVAVAAVAQPLVRLLSDSVEKIREGAAALLTRLVATLPDPRPLLPSLLPALAARIGSTPVAEPSEEVRLALTQLLASGPESLIPRCGAALAPFAPELTVALARMLADPFADIKVRLLTG